ncbi:MAG: hypothetical protein ACE5GL_02090 [Calditrichia bacterium]
MAGDKSIQEELQEKGNKAADEVAKRAAIDDGVLQQLLEGVSSASKRVKNAAAKALRIVSESNPQKLYSRLNFFVGLMNGPDTILKWISMDILGNLSAVDSEHKIDEKLLKQFFALLADESLITAAHAVENLGKIALHKPLLREKIVRELLKPDTTERQPDCHNILAGKKIDAFAEVIGGLDDRRAVLFFVRKNVDNPRNATKNRAERFLRKFEN